ncbi:MAG: DUF1015 domain-containing protein [Planctomycetes bacterium]|nr:DUF1015 domain-containing protein [Planctomycetota bacterium]
MVTIRAVRHALVPRDSDAAVAVSCPNYDEFQSDREVWDLVQGRPFAILRTTMPHCDTASPDAFLEEGSAEALDRAGANLRRLRREGPVEEVRDSVWVYSIEKNGRTQTGLLCMALTGEIRTEANPAGCIVRNEGIRESKARGRADLIQATKSFIGAVNNAIEDTTGRVAAELREVTSSRDCDFAVKDEGGATHRLWRVSSPEPIAKLSRLLAEEPVAYVADGNHRSAAAALLGHEEFLNVIFPVRETGIAPYNRLVRTDLAPASVLERASDAFEIEALGTDPFSPNRVHEIGLFAGGRWHRLRPKDGTFDPDDAAQDIDADIVQRNLFARVLGLDDPKDAAIDFVGGNKSAAYLQRRVESGDHQLAITLAPVTVDQFVEVCRQNRFMPPKSTWFDPKVRSGLVIALL